MELSTNLATPLGEWHRKHGAQMGVWFGCDLPDHFGDWQGEYRALRESVGLVDKNYRAYLEFTGPDRGRYLNAILTNDVKGLKENHGTASLFLNPQGHIQAEMETYALGESLFCVSYAMIRERLIPAMEKYIIMDDVTLTDRTDAYATLALEGPRAAALVQRLTGADLAGMQDLEVREVTAAGIAARMGKRSPGGTAAAEFLVEREKCAELWGVLEGAVRAEGGCPAGYEALNTVRLEIGIPWFGYDFGEKQIPHEAGLQDSHISYTKGCYTGQEIVERVRSRGQVNRVRVSLQFDGQAEPEADMPLLADGKEIGHVTRVGFSPAANAWIGMGYVRREKSTEGSALTTPKGTARVIRTPMG
ncbi:MAG TPA: aminomethyltransferase family protein [Candidatus Sulfotelmatobacter sp.]|nr:aminomethyltransferase family protein [Candidatus Sulfotelmatobacter sp.]